MKYLILILNLIFCNITLASDFSVFPLFLEFDRAKDKKQKFSVNIKSDGPLKIKTSLYKAHQNIDGKLFFEEEKNNTLIKFKKNSHIFSKKGIWELNGEINFKNKNSTDIYAVMIEEQIDGKKKGINVRVRYAVVLKTQNSTKRTFEKAELKNLEIRDDKSFIINFTNLTEKEQKTENILSIRNEKGKLILKQALKSLSSWQKGADKSIIFPKNTVHLTSPPLTNLKTGKYSISIRSKINNKRTIIFKDKIFIKNSPSKKKAALKEGLQLNPSVLELMPNKNGQILYRFEVKNNYNEKIKVNLPLISKNVKFIPNTLNVPAGKKKYIILKASKNDKSLSLKKYFAKINDGKLPQLPLKIKLLKGEAK